MRAQQVVFFSIVCVPSYYFQSYQNRTRAITVPKRDSGQEQVGRSERITTKQTLNLAPGRRTSANYVTSLQRLPACFKSQCNDILFVLAANSASPMMIRAPASYVSRRYRCLAILETREKVGVC